MDGIAAHGLADRVNLIVVADHGMTAISPQHAVFLDSYAATGDFDLIDGGALGLIDPKPGLVDTVLNELQGANPHMHVYRKSELPARFHYDDNRRIPPIVAIPDEGYMIMTHAQFRARPPHGGEHGYDNALPDMGALFVAAGPSFRRGVTVAPFQNVHVYDLVCHILGLTPAPNDGSLDSTRAMLRR